MSKIYIIAQTHHFFMNPSHLIKLLLVYTPFCTPSIMPYSISNLKGFLATNLEIEVKCLDLNAKFHRLRFKEIYTALKKPDLMEGNGPGEYPELLEKFDTQSRPVYKENNSRVSAGGKPDCFDEMLALILKEKPDIVAFSLVYNSQCFYAKALMDSLLEKGIKILIGGPADTSKLSQDFRFIHDEHELSEYLMKEHNLKPKKKAVLRPGGKSGAPEPLHVPDFSDYDSEDYLTKELIIPIKASSGCCYRQCAFCTHHRYIKYQELELGLVKKTIMESGAKRIFFIDDLIPTQRLMELAKMVEPLGITWAAQLRPTKDLLGRFDALYKSGARALFWGVESGSARILKLMKKGTSPADAAAVLKESHKAGIRNTLFIMFGFPGETRAEFLETIDFLKANSEYIDLISTSNFGLQKGSYVYEHPEEFGITPIEGSGRSILAASINYTMNNKLGSATGLDKEAARRLKSRHMSTIKGIEKLPRVMNYFKEQVMLFPLKNE